MPVFTLHPQLEKDSFLMRDLPLCQLRLNNQKVAPWLVLVPRLPDVSELFHLTSGDQHQLMTEITRTSKVLHAVYAPDKINVAVLGNMVPQLHVHVIGRYKSDEAWPNPVWGRISNAPYELQAIDAIRRKLNDGALWS